MTEVETGCLVPMTVAARDVRPGDVVIEDGDRYEVHHAMTTGKKARTTSLTPLLRDPHHYHPDHMLTIERRA